MINGKEFVKICHIADTHIKLIKQHKEYEIIFDQIYAQIKIEKPDLIIHCGDLFHSKTNLSPEAVQMTMDFLKNLADISPTYVIPGNHDLNLSNIKRLDAISPIVDALQHSNLFYLKDSQEVFIGNDLCINAFSMLDGDKFWKKISDPNKINIALYHGSVSGVETDTGYILEHGDYPIEIFEGFDYGLLGDIHKTYQILDKEGRIAYPGSTVQQNHGETNDKGFLIWEIKDKDNFSCRHFPIINPNPFITVELEADGQLPENAYCPINAKLRLVSNTHISLQVLKKAVDIAKTRFKPESITVHNRPGKRISIGELSGTHEEDNLRDTTVQESLMREYLKEYKLSPTIEQKVFDMNKKYNILAEQTEEVARNVQWKLKSVEWDNLFNYGEGNKINFENLHGILGIFGKNYTGKSSVIDSILWTIFNSVSKNVRKTVDIINQNKNKCFGKVELEVGDKIYTIERESEKYVKKLYGEETVESKTILNFNVFDRATDTITNLNGLSRPDTDANIRKVFGSIDDFLLTSMTSQMGSLTFINEGSTKRKEIFGKFLDLEMFDKKFKLAKDDSSLLRGAMKRLEGKKFDEEITAAIVEINENTNKTNRYSKENLEAKTIYDDLNLKIKNIDLTVARDSKHELIDINSINKSLETNEGSLKTALQKDVNFKEMITDKQMTYLNITKLLGNFDYEELKVDKEKAKEFDYQCRQLGLEITLLSSELDTKRQKLSILGTVPCGDLFPTCRFLVDANEIKKTFSNDEEKMKIKEEKNEQVHDQFLEANSTKPQLEEYEAMIIKKQMLEKEIAEISLRKEQNNSLLVSFQTSISINQNKKNTYFENETEMKQLETAKQDREQLKEELKILQADLDDNEKTLRQLYNNHGSAIQKKLTLEKEQQELVDLRDEFLAYDLYSKCMHSNGIVYDIIKKKLPIINQEIAKVLSNIVNFDVFFEDDGKKLDIYIRHPKYEPRPLELGSGAEKSIAAIAIRLALIKVSSLPVSDVLILDEPATSLDEENMEGFTRILEMIKSQFKIVIMISHLDALKDMVDDQISIEQVNGFARINM